MPAVSITASPPAAVELPQKTHISQVTQATAETCTHTWAFNRMFDRERMYISPYTAIGMRVGVSGGFKLILGTFCDNMASAHLTLTALTSLTHGFSALF